MTLIDNDLKIIIGYYSSMEWLSKFYVELACIRRYWSFMVYQKGDYLALFVVAMFNPILLWAAHNERIIINAPLLALVDRPNSVIDCARISGISEHIHDVIERKIPFNGEPYTIDELAYLSEQGLIDSETEWKLIQYYVEDLFEFSYSYLKKLRMVQSPILYVLSIWATQRQSVYSVPLLQSMIEKALQVAPGQELQNLFTNKKNELPQNIKEFYLCLLDLDSFFQDLMYSCPTAYNYYLYHKKEEDNLL